MRGVGQHFAVDIVVNFDSIVNVNVLKEDTRVGQLLQPLDGCRTGRMKTKDFAAVAVVDCITRRAMSKPLGKAIRFMQRPTATGLRPGLVTHQRPTNQGGAAGAVRGSVFANKPAIVR